MLLGTERFSISDDTHVVGELGKPFAGKRLVLETSKSIFNALRMRPSPFSIAETLAIVDPTWQPFDVLVCVCLAFRSEVISYVRSP